MEARSIQMSSDLSESKNSALSASNSARNSLANSDTARVNSELALEQSKDARNEADSARQYASQVGEFTHRINRIRHNEQSLRRDLAKTKQHYKNMICGINNALVGLLLLPVFCVPLVHLFVSTSRMKVDAESNGNIGHQVAALDGDSAALHPHQ